MSKKRKKSIPVCMPKEEKPMVINVNKINLKKQHEVAGFRTGGYMTEKDRPRKKNWKRECERSKDSRCNDYKSESF